MCEEFGAIHLGPNAKPGHMCAHGDRLEWLRARINGLQRVMNKKEAVSYVANALPNATTPGGANLAEYLAHGWTTTVAVLIKWEGTTMTALVRGWDDNEEKYYLFTRTY